MKFLHLSPPNLLLALTLWFYGSVMPLSAAPQPNFTVFGWVKQKVSGERFSSSSNSSIRRLPVNPSYQGSPQIADRNPFSQPERPPFATQTTWGPQVEPTTASHRPTERNRSSSSHIQELRQRCHSVAQRKYHYVFGGDLPSDGGLDCSGTVQYILKSMDIPNVPRTSYNQYEWLKQSRTLNRTGLFHSSERAWRNLQPGDLVFWGKTWNSGHKVSHVMIYLGQSPTGKKFMFGARGRGKVGITGAEVDVFELNRDRASNIVGYGRIPGLRR